MILEMATQAAATAATAIPDAQQAAVYTREQMLFFFQAMTFAGAFAAIGFAAMGAAYGCGIACSAAVGAWKKCYSQNKPAPFQLLVFAGAPLSQVIYGMIIMFVILGKPEATHAAWMVYLFVGIVAGIAMGISSVWQGTAAAAACDAFAENGKGFTNQLMVLGIVETVAIFVMAFSIVLLSKVGTAAL